jgi:hypothetical protein
MAIRCMKGISRRHHGHHVAQKLIHTARPLSAARLTRCPVTVGRVKFGGTSPTCRPTVAGAEADPINAGTTR